jgi:colanic acid/amylovoran biosynthesis glycosyltransferase
MRVALVVHQFPEPSEGFLVDHALGLLAEGLDVHVVADQVDRAEIQRLAPALTDRVHRTPGRAGLPAAAAAHPVATLRHLRRIPGRSRARLAALTRDLPLLGLRPDVVHTEFVTLARDRTHLPATLGCRLTTSVRGYDVAYAGLADPDHYTATWPALTAVHVLGADLWTRAQERGCPPDLAHQVISPAVDVDRVSPADPGGDGPLRLLSVGRLHWKKGHHHVLAALAHLVADGHEATLRIVGDGPDLEAVAFARHQLGLDDRVELVGGIDRAAVGEELGRAQVFVHGAVTEGFGNAVLEAQAAGLPVVCTDAEGLTENVDDGLTGMVVPRRDPVAMAEALRALAVDPQRRVTLGRAGRERVAAHFTPEAQRAAFAAFFRAAVT